MVEANRFVPRPTYEDIARLILPQGGSPWLNAHLEWSAAGQFVDQMRERIQPTKTQARQRLFSLSGALSLVTTELGSPDLRAALAIDLARPLNGISALPFQLSELKAHVDVVTASLSLSPPDAMTKQRLVSLSEALSLIRRELDSTALREILAVDAELSLKDVSVLPSQLVRLKAHVDFVAASATLARPDGTTISGRNRAFGSPHFSAKTRCAARVVELWLHFRGYEPGPQSPAAAKVAQMYWLAAGGDRTSLSSWRDHFDIVKDHKDTPALRNQRQLWRMDLQQNARNGRTPWYLGYYARDGTPAI